MPSPQLYLIFSDQLSQDFMAFWSRLLTGHDPSFQFARRRDFPHMTSLLQLPHTSSYALTNSDKQLGIFRINALRLHNQARRV